MWTAGLLLAIGFTAQLGLAFVREFDPDELEHLHGAWLISKGMLPYRDYFEHHTPGLHFLLAPVSWALQPETDPGRAFAMIFLSRGLMWLFTGVILFLTIRLGAALRDYRVGLVAAVLLLNVIMFSEKALEIRPDLLSVTFWLASLLSLLPLLREARPTARTRWVWAGALLGAGVMCTQKLLFVLPGVSATLLWYLADPAARDAVRIRLGNIAAIAAGFSIPILVTMAYFAAHHGLSEFFTFNVMFNAGFKSGFTPYRGLMSLVEQNPLFVAFAVVGLAHILLGLRRAESSERGDAGLVLNSLGLFAGLWIIPVAYRQYYFMALPLWALLAAVFLVGAIDTLADRRVWLGAPRRDRMEWSVRGILLLFALGATLGESRPRLLGTYSLGPAILPVFWGLAVVLMLVSLRRRAGAWALAVLVLASTVHPLAQVRYEFLWRNTQTLADIRYVLEHTSPSDSIFDGFTGLGVFRPHAFFYFPLTGDIMTMLPDVEKSRIVEDLRTNRVSPALIVRDPTLLRLPPPFASILESQYKPVVRELLWRRKRRYVAPSSGQDDRDVLNRRAATTPPPKGSGEEAGLAVRYNPENDETAHRPNQPAPSSRAEHRRRSADGAH
jgi:hypothetical protein